MASRSEYRKRERSWERDDRERERDKDRHRRSGRGREDGRRRSSRSRSPRRSERDRRDYDRRDYKREREDDRRDKDHRRREDGRDRDHEREREHKRDRDERKTAVRREDEKAGPRHDDTTARDSTSHGSARTPQNQLGKFFELNAPVAPSRQAGDETKDDSIIEEGEETDVVNDDDAAMMASMGMTGFGTTKGKHVVGNQEGAVNVKKVRTWRQYMNRRGGFNRPLDKIK